MFKRSLPRFLLLLLFALCASAFVFSVRLQARLQSAQEVSSAKSKSLPTEGQLEFKLLATNRVATMQKEMVEAAAAGYRFEKAVSGETAFGGNEVVVIMSRLVGVEQRSRYEYKLLATTKTSTMEKELQEAGDAGFAHRDETVFKKVFGTEVAVILERDLSTPNARYEYKLLAAQKTSTLQKEMMEAGAAGFTFVGISSGGTFFGGKEVVAIMRRPKAN